MVFSSLSFLCVFLPIALLLAVLVPSIRAKNIVLVLLSLVFYAYGEPIYVILMLISALVNWLLGQLIGRAQSRSASRGALIFAIIFDLGMLGVFKYSTFVVKSLNAGFSFEFIEPNIALPIGISFYTFQALSYVIDVYRGDVPPERNFMRVLLYIAFFPQLIAGPIIRYHDVAEQIASRRITLSGIACGMRRFCVGLAKKVLIANTMALTADAIFAAPFDEVNIAVAWVGALAYLFQIYFDFSGYSDMAIGLARMFGFTYKENFNYPYISTSVQGFWRRWHISLSTWFKEYLYIPLGGNRKGKARAAMNKIIVFFCCGLWHGAAWTFVIWGLIHGFFLLLEEYLPLRKLPKPLGWLYCMLVVTFAFVLFRAESIEQGLFFMQQMIFGWHFEHACVVLAAAQLTPLFLGTVGVAIIASCPIKGIVERHLTTSRALNAYEVASFALAFVLLVLCLLCLASGGYNPFIYFRF